MKQQLKNVWLLTVKDFKLFASDRLALFFAILFPFMFVILFNILMQGVGSADSRLTINLVTQEQGGISSQIIAAMETKDVTQLAPGEPEIVWLNDYTQANKDVADKKINGFVAFPANFTEAVTEGYGCQLEVVYNPADSQTAAALNGMAQSIASTVGAQEVANSAAVNLLVEKELASPGSVTNLADAIRKVYFSQSTVGQANGPVTFTTQKVGDVQAENPANFVIPGYLVMFTFMTASFAAMQIVWERRTRTLERMMSAGASRSAILGGIFCGTAIKGLVQMIIFWGVGVLAFHINLGITPGAVLLVSLLVIIMSSSFGVMLATLVKTERSASSVGVLASLILAPLGGCWWPLFIVPSWMQFLAKFTPHGWATTAFNKLLIFGGDFKSVVPDMLVILGFAVLFATIAVLRFKTEAD